MKAALKLMDWTSIMKKIIPLILLAIIIPQVTFAAWWNPFSWKIFHREESKSTPIEAIEVLDVSPQVLPPDTSKKETTQIPVTPTPTPIPTQKPKTQTTPLKMLAPSSQCNSNYSGCLKRNAGDYDCAGGSGNGPNYSGMVQIIGYDEYGLDRDGDGWGCEN